MNNNPSILWAQDRTHLFITIEIHNFKNQEIVFSNNNIKLDGSSGDRVYEIVIDLHSEIETEESDWSIKQNKVELNVKKSKNIYWQKLTKNKQNNIKIDWQRWRDEDEEEEENVGLMNDFSNFTKQLPEDFLNKNFEDMIDNNSEDLDIEELEEDDLDLNNENLEEADIDTEDNSSEVDNNSSEEFKKLGGIEVLEEEDLELDTTNLE